jgi:predicted phage-related endonuclease
VSGLSEEQLAYRRRYVCGSDAKAVMDGNWLELWKIKTGAIPEPDLYDKLSPTLDYHVLKHFTRERLELTRLLGHATEDLNAFWYEKQTGREVHRRGEWAVSKRHAFMGAHLDGVSTTSRGEPCYWDAKWTGRADEAFVLRHTPQGVHNATILGLDWWGLSVFIGNGKWEWIEQPVDPLYQAQLIAKEREFWSWVERGEEPPDAAPEPVAAPKPQPKLRTILLDELTPGGTDWPNWSGEFTRLARTFAETHGAATAHAITREAIKALVPADVGLCRLGLVEYKRDGRGVTISLKQEKSDG